MINNNVVEASRSKQAARPLSCASARQIGLLEGFMPAVTTVSIPMWGIVADKFHCCKNVFLTMKALITAILLTWALPYVYKSFSRVLMVSLLSNVFISSGISLDSYMLEMLGTAIKV
jgi:hypothetical protein